MARLRSPAQRAPQTREQALVLLARAAALSAEISGLQADRQASLAAINGVADTAIVPLDAEIKDIVKQLKPWFAANVDELTGGKRKSIELGGCLIGYRTNPPKMHFAGGDDDAAVAALLEAELAEFIRTKLSPDKQAILKVLDEEEAEQLAKLEQLGFSARQTEVFFVDPLAPQPQDGTVIDAAEASVQ